MASNRATKTAAPAVEKSTVRPRTTTRAGNRKSAAVEKSTNKRARKPDTGKLETLPWDAAEFIDSDEAAAAYIEAAFEDGHPAVIAASLGAVARYRGMTSIAKEAGVTREALYRALSADGDPRLSTLMGVMKAFKLQLTVTSA